MTTTLRDELRTLVAHYGLSIIQQPKRCKAYLMDCCGKQRREILALIAAQEEQIVQRLLSAPDSIPPAMLMAQLTAQLLDSHPLDPAIARWAVETWAYVVSSIPNIRAIRPPADVIEDMPAPTPPPPPPTRPVSTPPTGAAALQGLPLPQAKSSAPATPPPATAAPPTSKPAPLPFTVPALDLDFGAVAHWMQAAPQEIRLTNPSAAQVLYGAARSTLPWLAVTPTGFSCQPKQTLVLTVTLTPAAARLSPKSYTVADAIRIESGAQHQHIGVRIDLGSMTASRANSTVTSWIKEPEIPATWPPSQTQASQTAEMPSPGPVSTTVSTPATSSPLTLQVDFGAVSGWTEPLPSQELRLPNPQTHQETAGTARSTLPWLDVSPGGFVCQPGLDVRLTVQLTKAVTRLRPKMYEVPDAVVVELGGLTYQVSVQLIVNGRE